MSRRMTSFLITALTWVSVALVCVPVAWMIISSLRPNSAIIDNSWSFQFTLAHYQRVFGGDFAQWFLNSLIVAVGVTVLVILLGTLAAYSLTRFRYPGRQAFSFGILLTYFVPKVLMIVPVFLVIRQLGLVNSYLGLVLAVSSFALPFAVWLLYSYMRGVPVEVEEAAMADGAHRARVLLDVVLPQAAPGIISTAIFTFLLAWNDYLFALALTSGDRRTLPAGIASFATETNIEWGPLMAACSAATVPVVLAAMLLQRRFVASIGSGAVKG